jgi:hypothetical protein
MANFELQFIRISNDIFPDDDLVFGVGCEENEEVFAEGSQC